MDILESFNNREIAIAFWLAIFVLIILSKAHSRKASLKVLNNFFHWKIIVVLLSSIIYCASLVLLFKNEGFWDPKMAKDTFKWFIGTAIVMIVGLHKIDSSNYFKVAVLNNFKLIIVFQFIINLTTFSLSEEILLCSLLFILTCLSTYAAIKKKAIQKKVSDTLLSIFGLGILLAALIYCIQDFQKIATIITLKSFFLPVLLTLSFLPFLYVVTVIMKYEVLFARIRHQMQHRIDLFNYFKKRILMKCHLNLSRLIKISNTISIVHVKNKREVDLLIEQKFS